MSVSLTRTPAATVGVIVPDLIVGIEAASASNNRVFQAPSGGQPAADLYQSGSLRGKFTFTFSSMDTAWRALFAHQQPGRWVISYPEIPGFHGLSYVVDEGGTIRLYQSDSRRTWLLDVDFAEVG